MRTRYALAALFVAVVGGLILVRDAGYLGGRTEGGPLKLGLLDQGAFGRAAAGETLGAAGGIVMEADAEVRVASVEPVFLSPGLKFRAPRVGGNENCASCYPRRARPVVGSTLATRVGRVVFGLRARRPGVYFALGLEVDYRQGSRRFRYRDDQTLCLSVGRRNQCPFNYALPDDVEVAEAGGPSRFGAPLREGDGTDRGLRAVYPLVAGTRRPAFTLTNLTGETVAVRDVAITRVQGASFSVVPGAADPPAFRLAPRGSRRVRLDVAIKGCLDRGDAVGPRVSAEIDGRKTELPMSVGFEFRGRGCP